MSKTRVANKRIPLYLVFMETGKSGSEILSEMSEVYGDECPKKTMIYKWIERFSDGC